MSKKNARTVATRLSLHELAKARDGLLARGIKEKDLQTTSQILRLAVYFAILNCNNPKDPPTSKSEDFVRQLWKQTKITKNLTIDELSDK